MPRNPNAEPKPFVLVDIPSAAPERKPATTHEKFSGLTGRLELTFTVVSEYLFVGSGAYEFDPHARGDRPDVWYTFYRRNGQICVPGTSIKGAIRTIVEAISNSCVSQIRRPREQVRSNAHQLCRFKDENSPLCPACRLFGTTGYRGRVHFSDFLLQSPEKVEIVKIGELWEPKRVDPSKRRFYEQKKFEPVKDLRPQSGFRFVEAVPKGTKFQGILAFENLSEAELGLILRGLGWTTKDEAKEKKVVIVFTPKIGGAKPRCFGSVKFSPVRLRLWGGTIANLLVPPEIKGPEMLPFLFCCLQESREKGLLHSESWETLVQGFQPKGTSCPKELY